MLFDLRNKMPGHVRVLTTYGGLERWKKVSRISAHQRFAGVLWPLKNK